MVRTTTADVVTCEVDVVADVASDDAFTGNPRDWLAGLRAGYDVAAELVTLHGPGGGHPVVRLTGGRSKVERLLRDWGYDAADVTVTEVRG